MQRCRWSAKEDARLTFAWGATDLFVIAKRMKRTPYAITMRARHLGLGSPSRGSKTMNAFVRSSGYSRSRIYAALEALGLTLHRRRRSDPRQCRRTNALAVTFEQEQAVLRFLKKRPDGERLYRRVGDRTTGGVWGIGKKPKECVVCETSERPHFACGHCRQCYNRMRRYKRHDEIQAARPCGTITRGAPIRRR